MLSRIEPPLPAIPRSHSAVLVTGCFARIYGLFMIMEYR
jgi:hypothetical protein